MKKAKNLLLAFIRVKWLKYAVVTVIAVALVGVADENSLYNHLKNKNEIDMLEAEIAGLKQEYEHNRDLIKQMDTDPRAVEKIARERFFMKRADEDIFVLSTDLENQEKNDETAE